MRKNLAFGTMAAVVFGCTLALSAAETCGSDQAKSPASVDEATRLKTLKSLVGEPGQAAAALPELVKCLKHDSSKVRALALECLGAAGDAAKPAVPDMILLVGDPDPLVRREVIEAIHDIHPGPQVVLPLLTKLLHDSDPAVRARVLHSLADRGSEAMPALIEALQDEETVYWACLVLGEIGPDAKAAVPALVALIEHDEHHIRREAIIALAEIGEASAPAVPLLIEALDDEINGGAATYALGMIGSVPEEAFAQIEANVKSDHPMLATVSAWTMARLNPDDRRRVRKATRLLIARILEADPEVRSMAAHGLLDLNPGPEITRPLWQKALEGADEQVVVSALDTMASLGAPVVPRLIGAMEFDEARAHVAYILGKIGPEAAPAVDVLVKYIEDDDPEVQREVLFTLGKIGPGAKAAVPALIQALEEYEGIAQYGACYALAHIGADAVEAKAALLKSLEGDDETLTLFSAWALAKIDPTCSEACKKTVPVLAKGLADSDAQFRLGSCEALCCLGERAKDAVAALKKATEDDNAHVRKAAAEALKAIGE